MIPTTQKPGSSRYYIWFPLLFSVVLVGGMLIGMKMQSIAPAVALNEAEGELSDQSVSQGKIEELLRYIEAKYVDEVDREELVQEAIDNVLKNLDPHSSYIPADQVQEVNEHLDGNFDGIGVEFIILEDTVVVVAPLADGPSEAAGILAGDKIVMIGDSVVAGKNLESRDIVDLLRGEKGSRVKVGIRRGAESKLRFFNISRDKIPMHSVDISMMLDNKTGYIKINRFSATTYEEFMKSFEELVTKKDMKDLVIDLRHNPGGYLQQATNILSQFFREKDKLLVYTEGRAVNRADYESNGRPFFDVDDVVVLIDEGSASASEILAGAIQDQDRGIIIGRRSFGKGLVQEQYMLRDGSALRLTVARYYTPSGRSIQKPYRNNNKYDEEVVDRYASGELYKGDLSKPGDTTRFFTAKGHVVYGGGGITPDVFVPMDSILTNDYYAELRQHIPQFVFRLMEKQKTDLKKYSLDKFKKSYKVSDSVWNDFLAYAKSQGVKPDARQNTVCKSEINRLLKSRIAKHLFGEEGYYSIWNEDDVMINKALAILRKPNPLAEVKK